MTITTIFFDADGCFIGNRFYNTDGNLMGNQLASMGPIYVYK